MRGKRGSRRLRQCRRGDGRGEDAKRLLRKGLSFGTAAEEFGLDDGKLEQI